MRVHMKSARNLSLTLGLIFSTEALAQPSSVRFQVHFAGHVDCDQPIRAKNIPISGNGTGILNADGSTSADLTETAFVFSNTIHFEGRLGAAPRPAPGGTTQTRVAGKHSLRLIWNLPNNQLIANIAVSGQSCSASFVANLFPGRHQYTLFDGSTYHYCGRPRVEQSSCQVR